MSTSATCVPTKPTEGIEWNTVHIMSSRHIIQCSPTTLHVRCNCSINEAEKKSSKHSYEYPKKCSRCHTYKEIYDISVLPSTQTSTTHEKNRREQEASTLMVTLHSDETVYREMINYCKALPVINKLFFSLNIPKLLLNNSHSLYFLWYTIQWNESSL